MRLSRETGIKFSFPFIIGIGILLNQRYVRQSQEVQAMNDRWHQEQREDLAKFAEDQRRSRAEAERVRQAAIEFRDPDRRSNQIDAYVILLKSKDATKRAEGTLGLAVELPTSSELERSKQIDLRQVQRLRTELPSSFSFSEWRPIRGFDEEMKQRKLVFARSSALLHLLNVLDDEDAEVRKHAKLALHSYTDDEVARARQSLEEAKEVKWDNSGLTPPPMPSPR